MYVLNGVCSLPPPECLFWWPKKPPKNVAKGPKKVEPGARKKVESPLGFFGQKKGGLGFQISEPKFDIPNET